MKRFLTRNLEEIKESSALTYFGLALALSTALTYFHWLFEKASRWIQKGAKGICSPKVQECE